MRYFSPPPVTIMMSAPSKQSPLRALGGGLLSGCISRTCCQAPNRPDPNRTLHADSFIHSLTHSFIHHLLLHVLLHINQSPNKVQAPHSPVAARHRLIPLLAPMHAVPKTVCIGLVGADSGWKCILVVCVGVSVSVSVGYAWMDWIDGLTD